MFIIYYVHLHEHFKKVHRHDAAFSKVFTQSARRRFTSRDERETPSALLLETTSTVRIKPFLTFTVRSVNSITTIIIFSFHCQQEGRYAAHQTDLRLQRGSQMFTDAGGVLNHGELYYSE